jgi:predicted transporter
MDGVYNIGIGIVVSIGIGLGIWMINQWIKEYKDINKNE